MQHAGLVACLRSYDGDERCDNAETC